MVIIAARPSVGKTALAESVADFWSTQAEHPILFASLEMGINQILDRTVSRYTGIPAQLIIRGQLNDQEFSKVESVMGKIEERRVWYLDDSFATTAAIRAACAKVRLMTGGLSGVVVDYLSLLKDSGDQEVQRVTRISRNLKAIAREFNVPMLVLSQLNRAVEQREDKHPKLYDLRESGAIEQDADVVLGLSRTLGTPYMDVEVLKNRQGPLDMVKLYFDPDRVTFHEENPNPEPQLRYNPDGRDLRVYPPSGSPESLMGNNPAGIDFLNDSMETAIEKQRQHQRKESELEW
jgi:replicative DNA helicase